MRRTNRRYFFFLQCVLVYFSFSFYMVFKNTLLFKQEVLGYFSFSLVFQDTFCSLFHGVSRYFFVLFFRVFHDTFSFSFYKVFRDTFSFIFLQVVSGYFFFLIIQGVSGYFFFLQGVSGYVFFLPLHGVQRYFSFSFYIVFQNTFFSSFTGCFMILSHFTECSRILFFSFIQGVPGYVFFLTLQIVSGFFFYRMFQDTFSFSFIQDVSG